MSVTVLPNAPLILGQLTLTSSGRDPLHPLARLARVHLGAAANPAGQAFGIPSEQFACGLEREPVGHSGNVGDGGPRDTVPLQTRH